MDVFNKIPENLPLLNGLNRVISGGHRVLSGWTLFAVQHLLGSTIPLLKLFEAAGVKRQDIHLVGKAYSSHPDVVSRLKESGYHVDSRKVFQFDPNMPYDNFMKENIHSVLSELASGSGAAGRILLIDDGGKAIQILHDHYKHLVPQCCGVEQTSRGARLVDQLSLGCPVVNVARSLAKTAYESPAIAQSMWRGLSGSLKEWSEHDAFRLSGRSALVSGYGYIGRSISKLMAENGFSVTVCDLSSAARESARNEGFSTDPRPQYADFNLIIGCSGSELFPNGAYPVFREGALLVNMASTDTEFSAWNLRNRGRVVYESPYDRYPPGLPRPLPWRSLYRITRSAGKTFFLANGGFPINFSGSVNPVPPESIQLTSALLFAGAVQAVKADASGFLDLDRQYQQVILDRYRELAPVNIN